MPRDDPLFAVPNLSFLMQSYSEERMESLFYVILERLLQEMKVAYIDTVFDSYNVSLYHFQSKKTGYSWPPHAFMLHRIRFVFSDLYKKYGNIYII
jgi:hypothetical protein